MERSNESKIISPFMPSLLHFANVKIAASIYNKLGKKTLKQIFHQTPKKEEIKKFSQVRHEVLLLVPVHLRGGVSKAVYGMEGVVHNWHNRCWHEVRLGNRNYVCYWRSDGMLDVLKTAQSVVLNVNIDIGKRFLLACRYCMEENIMYLWSELEASGKTENLRLFADSMAYFWVSWIRDGRRVPWRRAAAEFMYNPGEFYSDSRFSAFVPSLQLEEREKFVTSLTYSYFQDVLECICKMTNDEEDKILKEHNFILLGSYSNWPLQSLLIPTIEKMWRYLSEDSFRLFLISFFERKANCQDYDYFELFGKLWDKTPVFLKKSAKRNQPLKAQICRWLSEIEERRKANRSKRTTNKILK